MAPQYVTVGESFLLQVAFHLFDWNMLKKKKQQQRVSLNPFHNLVDQAIYLDGSRVKFESQTSLVGYLSWDDLKEILRKTSAFQSGYIFQDGVSELFLAYTWNY